MKSFKTLLEEIQEIRPNIDVNEDLATKLQVFLADLHVAQLAFHNLHWNIIGPSFASLHKAYDDVYGFFDEQIDLFAERIRALGFPVPASMDDYLHLATLNDAKIEAKNISTDASIGKAVGILEQLSNIASNMFKNNDEATKNMLADFQHKVDKFAWLIRSNIAK